MKAPAEINALSLAEADAGSGGAYPSLGFRAVWDAELGNGDFFGLYWPYGREDRDPIVCDMLHDEWSLVVAFSNVRSFVKWVELNDGCRGEQTVEDPGFVGRRFQDVKPLLQAQPEAAISALQQICEDFPESAEYWYTLAGQLRRIGDHVGAHHAAIRSFTSNWAFGMPPNGALKMVQNAGENTDDPISACSRHLTMKWGGTKENTNYDILKHCIASYLASPTPIPGLLLNQNYGYMMMMETTSFQDRYGFDLSAWIQEHSDLCQQYLGDSRTQIC